MGEIKNILRILVSKSKRKIPLGRGRKRWKNNIKMDLKVTQCEFVLLKIGTYIGLLDPAALI
jgi:hypothetical protein